MKHSVRVIVFVCLVKFLSGCTTAPSPPLSPIGVSKEKRVFLKNLCGKYNVFCQWDSVAQTVLLRRDHLELARVLVGSAIVRIEEASVVLSGPVQMENSLITVPYDFERKVFFKKNSVPTQKIRASFLKRPKKIIIDAGHGGKDPGAIGRSGLQEKTVVLDVTKRLERILKKKGFKVALTRHHDKFISLQKRTEIASRSKADLFISIHANSSPSRGVQGMEVFSLRNLSSLERREDQRTANHDKFFDTLAMKKKSPDVRRILEEMLYDHKQEESRALAESLLNKTAGFVKAKNRGVKEARFYVLRNTLIPAVLVEIGFLSNPGEERLLKTSSYRQKLADGLARSLLGHVR